MPLLDTILASIENPAVPISSAEVLDVLGVGSESASGVEINTRGLLGLTAVWRGVNVLAGDVGKIPLEILRRQADGAKQRATDHPAYRLLRRRPSQAGTATKFKKTLVAHALLRGNGYAAIRRDAIRRAPVELMLLSPTPTTYPVVADGELWYVTEIDGEQMRLPAADVLHLAGLSWDGLEGLDVLTVLCDAFGLERAQQGHAARFFKHGTQAPGLLIMPGRMDEDEIQKVRDNWKEMTTSLERMHKPPVLWGGLEFKALGIDPQKAQLLQSREFGLVEIANVLGMPPHLLGHTARTSYNSLEMETASYLSGSLDPWLVALEEECGEKLLTDADRDAGLFAEFNRKAILRTDTTSRIAAYAKLRETGVMSANQVAAAENLPSQGPQGDRYYVPGNWVPVGEEGVGGQGSGVRDQAALLAAHRAALVERAEHLMAFERRNVERAAGREKNFLAWLDGFYSQHEAKLVEALLPAAGALYAGFGRGDPGLDVQLAARAHVERSRQQLLELTGRVQAAGLGAAVEQTVRDWQGRAEGLADWIIARVT